MNEPALTEFLSGLLFSPIAWRPWRFNEEELTAKDAKDAKKTAFRNCVVGVATKR
ncbi:MAG: hypothetical protein GX927_10620 [Lentisphaerae bacterium]|jgi:hypothetical protein|nr:hypothetical protein [Lentisphaerota bacterium]